MGKERRYWICPECDRLNWTCVDRGPRVKEHDGWAKYRGEKEPPKCSRHPKAKMVLKGPSGIR